MLVTMRNEFVRALDIQGGRVPGHLADKIAPALADYDALLLS